MFFFSAHHLVMQYIYIKFYENIHTGIKVKGRMRFSLEKFQRDIIQQKLQVELLFFFSAHHLITLYICNKFHENIFQGIKVIEQTLFSKEKFQRGIILQQS